jgi:hypothetical protein
MRDEEGFVNLHACVRCGRNKEYTVIESRGTQRAEIQDENRIKDTARYSSDKTALYARRARKKRSFSQRSVVGRESFAPQPTQLDQLTPARLVPGRITINADF